jgi:uncharacterized protein
MRVIGIDLSGPSNHKDTVLTVLKKHSDQLNFIKLLKNISDKDILDEIGKQAQREEVVIGIDAPLSYQDGGGDHESDKLLRKFIVALGMKSGSIMPPTFNRMVYLTLRGIRLTREIHNLHPKHPISIVEVHPGAIIGTRLNPMEMEYVLTYKQDLVARRFIREWLKGQNLYYLPEEIEEESHTIDACAAALGAWHWKDPLFESKWRYPANPPLHPFDYCC